MKAIVLTAYGDTDKLELRDVPDPKAGAGQIAVRMAGAGINPVDWKLRSGALKAVMPLELPAILGRDASGEVVELGSGVTQFALGDRVMGLVMGGYAERVVAAVDAWAVVPPKMSVVDAGALPLVLLTGAQLVEEHIRPRDGEVVLVIGAEGSVGRVAVFAAKALGAKVWAGVRGSQKAGASERLGGVAGVVALDDDADIAKLPSLDSIADTIGGPTLQKVLGKVRPGGVVASVVGEPTGNKMRSLVARSMLTHADAKRLGALARAVESGKLAVPIARRLPLAEAAKGQTLAEHHPGGKVLLVG